MTEYDQYLERNLDLKATSRKASVITVFSLNIVILELTYVLISPYFDHKQQYYSALERINKESISLYNAYFCVNNRIFIRIFHW